MKGQDMNTTDRALDLAARLAGEGKTRAEIMSTLYEEIPMEQKDGGPAYPGFDPKSESPKPVEGMSLRDWFAGQAMEGFLASWPVNGRPAQAETWAAVAAKAYEVSDAMLAARSGGET